MNVAVIGAGLGGLLAAAELRCRDIDVTVFEADDHVGGVARTIRQNGYLLEPGAGSFALPDPNLSPLLDAAGVELMTLEGGKRLYSSGDAYDEIPTSPRAFLSSPLLGALGKARVAIEPLIRSKTSPDESMHDFLVRRFGRSAGRIAAHLAVSGVFAGDARHVEAAAFPQLAGAETQFGSVLKGLRARQKAGAPSRALHVPRHGMDDLANALARYIGHVDLANPATSVSMETNGVTVNERRFDAIVLAVPPAVAADLLDQQIANPPTAPVAVVFLGGPESAMHLPGDAFGLLVGPDDPDAVIGVLFERGPERAPPDHQLAKVLVGGALSPAVASATDVEIVRDTSATIGRLLGHEVSPDFSAIVRREIPQYVSGHTERVKRVDAQLPSNVHLGGWWYRGIGVSSLAADARWIAKAIRSGQSGS